MKRKLFTIALLFGLLLTGGCQSDFTEEKTTPSSFLVTLSTAALQEAQCIPRIRNLRFINHHSLNVYL